MMTDQPLSKLHRVTRAVAAGTLACIALALALLVVYAARSEALSDEVAYRKAYPGQKRQDLERSIPGWTPRLCYRHDPAEKTAGDWDPYTQKYPGYTVVRYHWGPDWIDINADVYYDANNRVFMTSCNR